LVLDWSSNFNNISKSKSGQNTFWRTVLEIPPAHPICIFDLGPLGFQVKTMGQLFEASRAAIHEGDSMWPDIQLGVALVDRSNFDIPSQLKLKNNERLLVIPLFCGRPKSFGKFTLKDTDPASQPIIDFNYFSHPRDGQVVQEGR
jgi:hypothetical protein